MKLLIGIKPRHISVHACLKLGPYSEILRVAIGTPNKISLYPHFSKLLRNLKHLNKTGPLYKKYWWPVPLA